MTDCELKYLEHNNNVLGTRAVYNVNPHVPEMLPDGGRILGWQGVSIPGPTNFNYTQRGQPGWGARLEEPLAEHARLLKTAERMENTVQGWLYCSPRPNWDWTESTPVAERALQNVGHLKPHFDAINTRGQRKYVSGRR